MMELPVCPVCRDSRLVARSYVLDNGDSHWLAECPECFTEFRNAGFWCYNALVDMLDNYMGGCENEAPCEDDAEGRKWKCSACKAERTLSPGERPYDYCPDCGDEVLAW